MVYIISLIEGCQRLAHAPISQNALPTPWPTFIWLLMRSSYVFTICTLREASAGDRSCRRICRLTRCRLPPNCDVVANHAHLMTCMSCGSQVVSVKLACCKVSICAEAMSRLVVDVTDGVGSCLSEKITARAISWGPLPMPKLMLRNC